MESRSDEGNLEEKLKAQMKLILNFTGNHVITCIYQALLDRDFPCFWLCPDF